MILLMGLPGSGKGTQGKMMADQQGMHLISMGDLVRMYVTGERRQQMLNGILLDDSEIITIIDTVLQTIPVDEECVLDGFPRTIPQAEWLAEQVSAGRFQINHIIYLVASEAAVKARLQARGRADDAATIIDKRFQEYKNLTEPVVAWLKDHNFTISEINAEQPASLVNAAVTKVLQPTV